MRSARGRALRTPSRGTLSNGQIHLDARLVIFGPPRNGVVAARVGDGVAWKNGTGVRTQLAKKFVAEKEPLLAARADIGFASHCNGYEYSERAGRRLTLQPKS